MVLLCFGGCAKYTPDCEVIVMPRRAPVKASERKVEPAYQVKVFAYYMSEKEMDKWAPKTYAQAQSGQVLNADTGEIRPYNLMAQQAGDTYVHVTISNSPVMLVAVNEYDKFYAWRMLKYEIPTAKLEIVLRFMLWETTAPYKNSDWIVSYAGLDEAAEEDGEGVAKSENGSVR